MFIGQGTTESRNLKMFKSHYVNEFLRYGHVIIDHIDFKITFGNMGSHGTLSLISEGWPESPPLHLAEILKRRP